MTVRVFCLSIFLLRLRLIVGREPLGAYVGGLGPLLGPMLAVLGRSWGLCRRSCAALGAYVGGLGLLLGPMLAVLARSWALCWRSWAALGAYVGGLGLLLGPMLTVLGRFRGLSWRSWAKSGSNPSEDVIWQADQGRGWNPLFLGPGPSCRFFSVDNSAPRKF